MSRPIKELAKFVQKRHGYEAAHLQTVLVKEIAKEIVVWDAAMNVFDRPAARHGLNANFSRISRRTDKKTHMHKISRAYINITIGLSLLLLGWGQRLLAAGDTDVSPSASTWGYCNIGQADTKLQTDSNSTRDSASFTLGSTGAALGSNADALGFASGPAKLAGDCEIIAQVTKLSGGVTDWATGGIMIRENYGTGSKFISIGYTRGHGIQYFVRKETGAAVITQENCTDCKTPVWFKLVRRGNHFIGYQSEDGRVWLQLSELDITMKKASWAGIFATSGGGSPAVQIIFNGVSARTVANP
jgi:hypothetical protein